MISMYNIGIADSPRERIRAQESTETAHAGVGLTAAQVRPGTAVLPGRPASPPQA